MLARKFHNDNAIGKWPKLAIAATSLVFAAGTAVPATASVQAQATQCRNVNVPVTVGGQTGPISGTLCTPPGATAVQLLVHGWTYNRQYFDSPYKPDTYSYARAANRAGYATFAIDRLGAGASLHPPSLFHTVSADVAATHQVVQALRAGTVGYQFDKVISVGHSVGSVVASREAGRYRDVDALITTGFTHLFNYTNTYLTVAGHDHLAQGDPKFARSGLDPLYVTSDPGTRDIFRYKPNTEPGINTLDETLLKDTDSLVEGALLAKYSMPNVDRTLNIPVLNITGDHEPFFCGLNTGSCTSSESLEDWEKRWYGPDANVDAVLLPHTGHDIALEKTAPAATRRMVSFANAHVGPGKGEVDTTPASRPPPPPPPQGGPPVAGKISNAAFYNAVKPLADTYDKIAAQTPGLGDSGNPNPAGAHVLLGIADLADIFLHRSGS